MLSLEVPKMKKIMESELVGAGDRTLVVLDDRFLSFFAFPSQMAARTTSTGGTRFMVPYPGPLLHLIDS